MTTKPEKEIELGDVVYLKSGSLPMTVTSLTHEGQAGIIQAQWYGHDGNMKGTYAPKQCFTTKKTPVTK